MILPAAVVAGLLAALPAAKADAPERATAVEILGDRPTVEDARRAADSLGDGWRAAEKLRQADAADAVRRLRDRLAFVPTMEADTPPGWPRYTVVGEIELKRYPAHRLARTAAPDEGPLFGRLFQHIQSNDIPMTTPVETERGDDTASMAFLYPDGRTGTVGDDGTVEVVDVPLATFASIGVFGDVTESMRAEADALLRKWVQERPSLEAAGPLRVLGYNSPFVPRRDRYSEVQVPVKPRQQ